MKIVQIPVFQLTTACNKNDDGAVARSFSKGNHKNLLTYYHKPLLSSVSKTGTNYNAFPIVLKKDGSQWGLANLFVLDRLSNYTEPNMDTAKSLAEDLGAFRAWLDIDGQPADLLFQCPALQLDRVTYLYRNYLLDSFLKEEIGSSVAKRRINTVSRFYDWLEFNQYFIPDNPLKITSRVFLNFKSAEGFNLSKTIITSDLAIRLPSSEDLFDGYIMDGEKLRPLPTTEQKWVFETLSELENPEMYLILLTMILTGARIQTVCTFRRKHFENHTPKISKSISGGGGVVKLICGYNTNIDTKRGKRGVLFIPEKLYEILHTYCTSKRAMARREGAEGGDQALQYLFLTQQGTPYVDGRTTTQSFNPNFKRRQFKKGGTIRQFINDRLIPIIQSRYRRNFNFSPHDLRASYGMNTQSKLMEMVRMGHISPDKARQILKQLMWHESAEITDLYLNYQAMMDEVFKAVNEYGDQIESWIQVAKQGFRNE